MIFFLPPLVAPILTGSMALLLSSGEWGEWGVLTSSVALPPPLGSTPHDLLLARISLLPPRLSIIVSFTSPVPFPRRFPRSSLAVTIIIHFLRGFSMLLHLLCTIIMRPVSFVSQGSVCFFGIGRYHVFPGSKQPSGGGSISPFSTSSWRLDSCPSSFFFSVGPLSHYGSSLAFGAFQATCHQGCQSLFGCARHDPVLSSSMRALHPAFG